jgi:hypothetical protein
MLTKLFNAMAKMEGYGVEGKIPTRRNNPLDIRYAGQDGACCPVCSVHPEKKCQPVHAVAHFVSLGHGVAAGYRQLCKMIQQNWSLETIVRTWAPATENDTERYLEYVRERVGLTVEQSRMPFYKFLGVDLED